ncbi:unnamed protein product [Prunus armeniaca]
MEEIIAYNMKVAKSYGLYDASVLRMPIDRLTAKNLQEAWSVLKSSLEEYGISCALDVDQYFITFTTTKAKDSYAILDSRYLIRLLSAGVPPLRAVKVLNGMPCYLVYTGYIFDGLCKKFDIKPVASLNFRNTITWHLELLFDLRKDKYVSRKKLLMSLPVQELEKLTCCNIYLCPTDDMVAIMGPIRGMMLVRKIVEDCIVHNMPPAPRVRRLANYIQAIKGVEALRL